MLENFRLRTLCDIHRAKLLHVFLIVVELKLQVTFFALEVRLKQGIKLFEFSDLTLESGDRLFLHAHVLLDDLFFLFELLSLEEDSLDFLGQLELFVLKACALFLDAGALL